MVSGPQVDCSIDPASGEVHITQVLQVIPYFCFPANRFQHCKSTARFVRHEYISSMSIANTIAVLHTARLTGAHGVHMRLLALTAFLAKLQGTAQPAAIVPKSTAASQDLQAVKRAKHGHYQPLVSRTTATIVLRTVFVLTLSCICFACAHFLTTVNSSRELMLSSYS